MIVSRRNLLTIQTPEGISFSLRTAGPVLRFLAWLIDLACILSLVFLVGRVLNLISALNGDLALALQILMYFIISMGYGILTEWLWRGQSLGKRLLRLRVIDEQGLRLQFYQIFIRNLLRLVDNLPAFYLVGGVACLLSPRGQRLGDLAARTMVIWLPPTSEPDLEQILPGKYNSLRAHPHLAARLRQNTEPLEAGLALDALLRRDQFDPAARLRLFAELAANFRAKVKFPDEAVEGLSDEIYLRNVVDLLFKPR